jgi:hypothetical protein
MEFLGVAVQISEELFWVLSLIVILLFLVNDILEVKVACGAVPPASVRLDALVVKGVSAHEVDGWQGQGVHAAIALLGVEVFSLRLQVMNLLPHILDLFHILFHLDRVFADDTVLNF